MHCACVGCRHLCSEVTGLVLQTINDRRIGIVTINTLCNLCDLFIFIKYVSSVLAVYTCVVK